MKGFVKFCLLATVSLLVVGVIFAGVGFGIAGSQEINKVLDDLTDGRVHIKNGIHIGRSDRDATDSESEADSGSNMIASNVEMIEEAADSIEEMKIDLAGCILELKESEDTNIYVSHHGTNESKAYVKGDCLYVTSGSDKDWDKMQWKAEGDSIILYLPKNMNFDKVEINIGAGQMDLEQLKSEQVEINVGAGEIQSRDMMAEKLNLSVGAGSVVFQKAKFDEIKAEVGAGNCEISGEITGDVKAECALGNLTFVVDGKEDDFNYDVECVSGNLSIDGDEYSGIAKEVNVDNNASKKMELECAMGNIEVIFN